MITDRANYDVNKTYMILMGYLLIVTRPPLWFSSMITGHWPIIVIALMGGALADGAALIGLTPVCT